MARARALFFSWRARSVALEILDSSRRGLGDKITPKDWVSKLDYYEIPRQARKAGLYGLPLKLTGHVETPLRN